MTTGTELGLAAAGEWAITGNCLELGSELCWLADKGSGVSDQSINITIDRTLGLAYNICIGFEGEVPSNTMVFCFSHNSGARLRIAAYLI
jgi:hypothetical protein